jgi:hypothetical protein
MCFLSWFGVPRSDSMSLFTSCHSYPRGFLPPCHCPYVYSGSCNSTPPPLFFIIPSGSLTESTKINNVFCSAQLCTKYGLQEEQHEYGQGKREGNQKGKSDKIQSTAKGSTTLCTNLAYKAKEILGSAENGAREGDKRRRSRKHGDACGPWRG